MLYGYWDLNGNTTEIYEESDKEDLENYALILNSPWSISTENWVIEHNHDSTIKGKKWCMNNHEAKYRCIYQVIGYDGIEAILITYGNTVEEALNQCMNTFKIIQEKYNPDDESF